jgi:hypothetical protein
MAEESNAEKQLRLHHEQRCRRIADLVKAELPEDRGFILMTVQRGEPGANFSSADYVATVRPQDALRLLQEHMDQLSLRTGTLGEPTSNTATVMREHVYALMEGLAGQPPPSPTKLWQAFCRARAGQGSIRQRVSSFIALGVVAMVELEHLRREQLKAQAPSRSQPTAPPPPSAAELDDAAEEILRHAGPRDPNVPSGNTKTTLVADLRDKPASPKRDQLIADALAGRFHDFESESATPKVLLHDTLIQTGYLDLALKVINGAYGDEPPTTEQEEDLRQDIGPELFDKVMGNKPRGSA